MSLAQSPQAMAELDLGTGPGPDGQLQAATPPPRKRGGVGLLRGLVGNTKSVAGIVILIIFLLIAVFAPVISPGDPNLITGMGSQPPSPEHWLGTTAKGQDVLALNIWGSLLPGLPLLVILAAFLPQGLGTVILELVITGWAGSARVLRSQAMSIRGKDFVGASQVTGESGIRIMFREMLPNMASIVMSTFLACVIFGIGAQAGLEFLGLGDISTVSWGTNLYWASNDGALLTGAWWVFVPPGVSIALVAFALALVNYGVDETTNPRLRRPRRRTTPDEPTRVAVSAGNNSVQAAVSPKEQDR